MIELFIIGFQQILVWDVLLLIAAGVILGIFFGASPGLTTSTGIVLMLPITYALPLTQAIALLLGMYIGGVSGGLITAILLGIPGTPAAVPTTFDGTPLARSGQPGKALSIGILSSFVGGFIGFFILFIVAPPLARAALKFGPAEYLALGTLALALVSGLSGNSLSKGITSTAIGLSFGVVGLSPIDSAARYTFNSTQMMGGFQLIALLIGLYAIREVFKVGEQKTVKELVIPKYKMKGLNVTFKEVRSQAINTIRSALIGTGIGFLPGMGAGVASIMSYSVAKGQSKDPGKFGKGCIDGIVASESANNAVIGGALIPLLTLGIPGSAATAILLAAFTMQGIQPGPLFLVNQKELAYAVFATLVIANIFMIVIEFYSVPALLRVLRVKKKYILTTVIILCTIGAFGANNRIFDIWTVLIFSVIGYLFHLFKYPVSPMVVGFVLSGVIERNLYRALTLSKGEFLPIITRPIAGTLFIVTALYLVFFMVKYLKRNKQEEETIM